MKEHIRQRLFEQMGSSIAMPDRPRPIARKQARPAQATSAILVIDDEPSCLEFTTTVLQSNGYNILAAQSVAEGKALLQANPGVTLIITDLKMPREDGFSLLAYLRDTFRFSHIPTIVLTCCTDQNIILRAIGLGAREYLIKPFTADLLLTRVRRLYDKTKGNILLITDNEQTVVILKRTLIGDGFRVSAACADAEIRELLTREPFDVAVCELILEDRTGLDLLIGVRDDGYFLPFLFIADSLIKLSDEDIRSAGGFGLVKKPFNNNDVLRAVTAAITRSRHT
ncbi:MAG: response regulator [candidate division Zixibacteria bacterium]|nr:response regulator [candidate division Zixibacteria bacterium]